MIYEKKKLWNKLKNIAKNKEHYKKGGQQCEILIKEEFITKFNNFNTTKSIININF